MASFCSSVASSLNSRVTLKSSGPPSVRAWSLAISVTRTAVASSSDSSAWSARSMAAVSSSLMSRSAFAARASV